MKTLKFSSNQHMNVQFCRSNPLNFHSVQYSARIRTERKCCEDVHRCRKAVACQTPWNPSTTIIYSTQAKNTCKNKQTQNVSAIYTLKHKAQPVIFELRHFTKVLMKLFHTHYHLYTHSLTVATEQT